MSEPKIQPAAWEVEDTSRGFQIIRFKDRYDQPGTLQQSSLAVYQQPGAGAVWLGTGENRLHLDESMVLALVAHLQAWLDTGSFELERDPATSGDPD